MNAKDSRSPRPATEAGECDSCGEAPPNDCTRSERPCGHHCNHSWTHDVCHWCGATFGEDEPAARPATVSEEAVEAAWTELNAVGVASGLKTGGKRERDIVRNALLAALPLLTAQPEAEVRADERELALRSYATDTPPRHDLDRAWFNGILFALDQLAIARTAPAHDGSEEADHG